MVTLTLTFAISISEGSYQLSVPGEYTVLSGDLTVSYSIPEEVHLPSAFVRLYLLGDKADVELTNLPIEQGYPRGDLRVTCGIIEAAGKYEFRMFMHEGSRILVRAVVIARWPEVLLSLPATHVAQSMSVRVEIRSKAVCDPLLKKFDFSVELEYAKDLNVFSVSGKDLVIYNVPFTEMSKSENSVDFPCNLFEQLGVYRVSLKSSYSAIAVVARSNSLITTPNPKYSINLYKDTIFPCASSSSLSLAYSLAQCSMEPGTQRLRVFRLERAAGSSTLAAPVNRVYEREHILDVSATQVVEPCSGFRTDATGYCFQLVTFMSDGSVINQTEVCKSAHPDSGQY